MSNPVHDLHLDFETFSDLDLSQVGIHRYVTHPSFNVLALAWKIDERPVTYQVLPIRLHPDLEAALGNRNVQGHAFNAAFETAVLERLGIAVTNPLSCTMQRALAYGLPGKLEKAAEALGLVHQKDKTGRALMLRMTKPLKAGATPWMLTDFEALGRYCAADVDAEAELAGVIPRLPPEEWVLSQIDAAMNTRGELGIDLARVQTLTAVALDAERADAARCAVLTGNEVTSPGTQTARLLAWLTRCGVPLPDTQRATIEEALRDTSGLTPATIEVLQIRLRMARASPRKLARMVQMADHQQALRGQFQFVGAGRTGRWSGRGVQVQNLPRVPKDFKPNTFYDLALRTVIDTNTTATLGMVTPYPVLDCVSYSLRSCLKAADNARQLWSFDFSQIEARVLAWLAGQRDILAVFASGDDVYTWAAAQFGSTDRQLGKVLVLALGFGMGAEKLKETARKAYGVTMTPGQAERFKEGWRRANHHIVRFWYDMENAAKRAILSRGFVSAVGGSGVAFTCTARTLQMRLPSGRVLYYHQPYIASDTGAICYMGPEVGNRWVLQRTWGGKLAENATQAAARDIMSEAMLRALRREGLVPCMTVHDELVYTIDRAATGWSHLEALMLEAPPWAGGLPLAGEHKIMRRYGVPIRNI